MRRWSKEEVEQAMQRIFGRTVTCQPWYFAKNDLAGFILANPTHWLAKQRRGIWTGRGTDVPVAFFGDVTVSGYNAGNPKFFGDAPDAEGGGLDTVFEYDLPAPYQYFNVLLTGADAGGPDCSIMLSGWLIRLTA